MFDLPEIMVASWTLIHCLALVAHEMPIFNLHITQAREPPELRRRQRFSRLWKGGMVFDILVLLQITMLLDPTQSRKQVIDSARIATVRIDFRGT